MMVMILTVANNVILRSQTLVEKPCEWFDAV